MSLVSNDTKVSGVSDTREEIRVSIDLVAAARRHLIFLRTVAESHWLYNQISLRQAIRRYDKLWMPLISDLTVGTNTNPPILLPPLDVQWVWHCHTLNPESYRRYCKLKFSKILQKPLIYDDGNEEYALNRCSDVWNQRYPFESFELEAISEEEDISTNEEVFRQVSKHRALYSKFSEPYLLEVIYLVAAKQRYKEFMHLLQKFKDGYFRFVPTLDIQLMWLTHQSYPSTYAEDMKEIEGDLEKVIGIWDEIKGEDVERSKKAWEEVFVQPYGKAGATVDRTIGSLKPTVYWVASDADVNTKYKSMAPRFLLEVCIFMKRKSELKQPQPQSKKIEFIRLRTVRCHKELKIDFKSISSIPSNAWTKTWHLYCGFSTKGVILELRSPTSSCLKDNVRNTVTFSWNDLLRAPCLTVGKELGKEVRAVATITPPVQAPYLLKCVPDRATDDSGAMISDEILKMNRYRPQEGRWLSRTVLDHAGKECFVVRIRVGGGIWRRGGETPVAAKWEDTIIEVREGSWTYVAGSIGKAPEKVAGTAKPKEKSKDKASWILSTGDEVTVHQASSGLIFNLQSRNSADSVRLLQGRKMHYQVTDEVGAKDDKEQEEDEEAFVTLVRYTPGNPNGRATALINWRLVAVEILPEEDAVMVLLICMAILRSVSEMLGEDMGNLLLRRRLKEYRTGLRDWGSVVIHPSTSAIADSSSASSPFVQPWHWNAKAVMTPVEADYIKMQTTLKYLPAEGGDNLYKHGVLSKSKGLPG